MFALHRIGPIAVAFIAVGVLHALTLADPPATRPAHAATLDEARDRFAFEGRPIHPSVLYLFNPPMAGRGAVPVAIDVEAASRADAAQLPISVRGGTVTFAFEDGVSNWFGYQCLGTLDDGTAVVRVDHNSGGTGIFRTLLLVRFESRKVYPEQPPRLILHLRTSVGLGDRDGGAIALHGDHVTVGPWESRWNTRGEPMTVRP